MGKLKPARAADSQEKHCGGKPKTPGHQGKCPNCTKCDCDFVLALNRACQHLGYKGCDWRALAASQGYMGKERMALQCFNDCDYSVMATDPQVVALAYIVGQNNSGGRANSRKHRQKHASL